MERDICKKVIERGKRKHTPPFLDEKRLVNPNEIPMTTEYTHRARKRIDRATLALLIAFNMLTTRFLRS